MDKGSAAHRIAAEKIKLEVKQKLVKYSLFPVVFILVCLYLTAGFHAVIK